MYGRRSESYVEEFEAGPYISGDHLWKFLCAVVPFLGSKSVCVVVSWTRVVFANECSAYAARLTSGLPRATTKHPDVGAVRLEYVCDRKRV